MKKQNLLVLGSTGSIGQSTLDVAARHPERIEVFALSAHTQVDLLWAQCLQHRPRYAVMVSEPHARLLAEKIQAQGLRTPELGDGSENFGGLGHHDEQGPRSH